MSQTQFCNLFIKLSHIENRCKLALMNPLYKKDSKTDPKSFRLISLLPLVTKNVDKIIQYQTIEYLTDGITISNNF